MVFGDGEFDGVFETYEEIKDNVEACDMGQMDIVLSAEPGVGEVVASFAYVFDDDQEPDDIIYDYGINGISEQWARDYKATRHEKA
jgi:hypothetical protein